MIINIKIKNLKIDNVHFKGLFFKIKKTKKIEKHIKYSQLCVICKIEKPIMGKESIAPVKNST
jgi:putative heme iron utilization protein